jgi:hypothetical protein
VIELLQTPIFVVFASITIVGVAVTVAEAWTKTKKASLDAELKMEMLRQGMSADDICRVVHPSKKDRERKHANVDQA